MKTLITVLLALTASIVLSQETITTQVVTEKKATREDLIEALTTLSQKLESDTTTALTLSQGNIISLTEAMKLVQNEINVHGTFSKTIARKDEDNVSSSITYKIHLDENSDIEDLQDLKDVDFEGLRETLKEFVVALQDSPKMTELKDSLKKLEEKYPAPTKN